MYSSNYFELSFFSALFFALSISGVPYAAERVPGNFDSGDVPSGYLRKMASVTK